MSAGARVLLVGPAGHGGEEVYMRTLENHPPDGVVFVAAGSFHEGAPGAPCRLLEEVALNRMLHPFLLPDLGFRSLAVKAHFDVVHVHAHPVRLPRLRSTPLVMSEGSSAAVYLQQYLNWDDAKTGRGFARARRIYRTLGIHDRLLNLDRVTQAYVFSNWARQVNIRWGADPAKLSVLYPGFPTPAIVDRTSRDTFTFLFVGTDFERKGGFDVVEAFSELTSRHPATRLSIVSPDPHQPHPDRALHSWVGRARRHAVLARLEDLERRGLVERHGPVTRDFLYSELFPRADAFVMPTHAEGFGFTNVEGLSFGLPVISTRVGPIPEIVPSEAGLLVEPGDVGGLVGAMELLVSKPENAAAMGRAGRESFLERFTIDRFRSDLGKVYAAALERPCAAS